MTDVLNPAIRAYLQQAAERGGHEVMMGGVRTVKTFVKRKSAERQVVGTTRL